MDETLRQLSRIAGALERLSPPPPDPALLASGTTFVWRPHAGGLRPAVAGGAPLALLREVEPQKKALLDNTRRFAAGARANNALLWGVRGAGKSALVRAVHAAVAADAPALKLIEVPRDALAAVPALLDAVAGLDVRAIVFIDDLSFDGEDDAAKALKPALDGGLGGRAPNVIVYATSNRRHLMGRDARENAAGDLHWSDTAEERLALSDRFGLWMGFHALDQEQYLRIVAAYAQALALPVAEDALRLRALQWAMARGARSGRTAWQFILALAGELGVDARY
ncbi:MAG: ATP-binding protein [Hyphomonadaceae bacterium]|nr:ATP-binding protein [Hyphomonadaceae bacterium]